MVNGFCQGTIGVDGFLMVFFLLVNHCCRWFFTFQPLVLMVVSMVFYRRTIAIDGFLMVTFYLIHWLWITEMGWIKGIVNKTTPCWTLFNTEYPRKGGICQWMKSLKTTIGINGFTMIFGLTNHWHQWFCNSFGPATFDADSFEVRQPLDTMVFQ